MRTQRAALIHQEGPSSLIGPVKLFAGIGDSYGFGNFMRDWGHDKQFAGTGQYGGYPSDLTTYRKFLGSNRPLNEGAASPYFGRNLVSPFESFADTMKRRTGFTWICLPMAIHGTRETGAGQAWGVGGASHTAAIAQIKQGYADAQTFWPGATFEGIFRWCGANDLSLGTPPTRAEWVAALQAEFDDFDNVTTGISGTVGSSWWYMAGGILPECLMVHTLAQSQGIEFGFRDLHLDATRGSRFYYMPMPAGYCGDSNLHANPAGTRYMGREGAHSLTDATPAVIQSPNSFTVYAGQKVYIPIVTDKYATPFLSGANAANWEILEEGFDYGGALITWQSNRYVLRLAANANASATSYSGVTLNVKASNGVVTPQAITGTGLAAYGTASTGAIAPVLTQANNAAGGGGYQTGYFYNNAASPVRIKITLGVGKNVIRLSRAAGLTIPRIVIRGQDAVLSPSNTTADSVQLWHINSAEAGTFDMDVYSTVSGVNLSNVQLMVVTLPNTVDSPNDAEGPISSNPTTTISTKNYSAINSGGVVLAFGTGATNDAPGATGTLLTTGLATWCAYRIGPGVITMTGSNGAKTIHSIAFDKAP